MLRELEISSTSKDHAACWACVRPNISGSQIIGPPPEPLGVLQTPEKILAVCASSVTGRATTGPKINCMVALHR